MTSGVVVGTSIFFLYHSRWSPTANRSRCTIHTNYRFDLSRSQSHYRRVLIIAKRRQRYFTDIQPVYNEFSSKLCQFTRSTRSLRTPASHCNSLSAHLFWYLCPPSLACEDSKSEDLRSSGMVVDPIFSVSSFTLPPTDNNASSQFYSSDCQLCRFICISDSTEPAICTLE